MMYEQMGLADASDEYKAFVDKFKPNHKLTTDDCYTPENIYSAVRDWAIKEYALNPSLIVRPFWPGADYTRYNYPDGCTVIDNPPFSIFKKICDWYNARGIKYFLFAPGLTCGNAVRERGCVIITHSRITYHNGAIVNTAFVTNLDTEHVMRTAPALAKIIKTENDKNNHVKSKKLRRIVYPDSVITAALMQRLSTTDYSIPRSQAIYVAKLDNAKGGIFGGGYILSERAAAERAAAERAVAERAAEQAEEQSAEIIELSERERAMQRRM